jgi:hypothetical protein
MEAPAALRKRDIFYVASIMGLFILNLVGLFRFTAPSSHHEVARLSQRLSSVEENTEWVMDGLEKHLTWHERVNLAMKASKEKGGEGCPAEFTHVVTVILSHMLVKPLST